MLLKSVAKVEFQTVRRRQRRRKAHFVPSHFVLKCLSTCQFLKKKYAFLSVNKGETYEVLKTS